MFSSSMRDSDSEDIKEVQDPESFEELLRFVYCDRVSEGAIEAMGEDLLKVCCPKGVEFSLPTLVINFCACEGKHTITLQAANFYGLDG